MQNSNYLPTKTNTIQNIKTWQVWIDVGALDLTMHYLINEYRMIMGACDPTFKFAGAQARSKALLYRDAIRRGVMIIDEPC